MSLGQRDHRGDAGGIVDRAVADVIACRIGGAAAQMVPVRGVDDIFIRPRGARQQADHILRGKAANVVAERQACLHPQWYGAESRLLGGGGERGQILARRAQHGLCHALLHPAVEPGLAHPVIGLLGEGLRAGPARFDHVPAVSRREGIVDDQRGGSALAGCFLELVGPAPVIGHRAAIEGAGGGYESAAGNRV